MNMISYKYRIYPTKSQVSSLEQTLETCRQVYNWLLQDRESTYKINHQSLSYFDQTRRITVFKQTWLELQQVNAYVLENVAKRVDLSFESFFRRVKSGDKPGYPRAKSFGSYSSFTYRQDIPKVKNSKVNLSKIGNVKIKYHRPMLGKAKTLTISKQNNKWYATFSCEVETPLLPTTDTSVGIDVGLTKFATLSNGDVIANPSFFRKDEKVLAKAQRKLSKKTKGSLSHKKAKKVLSHIHEKIANKRKDFAHKLSRKLVNEFGIICVEDLVIEQMVSNHRLAKSISDASWNQFISYLVYKAEHAGRLLIKVNPAYTSQDCSSCGFRVKKTLGDRIHNCPECGLIIDRDLNASYNILRLGLQSLSN